MLLRFLFMFLMSSKLFASNCVVDLKDDIDNSLFPNFGLNYVIYYENDMCEIYKGCKENEIILDNDYKNKNFIKYIEKLADSGNVISQITAGVYYINYSKKYNINKYNKAEKYLLKALKSNHPRAYYALGVLYYLQGKNTKSATYFKISSDLGYTDASLITALNYFYGRYGLPINKTKFFILSLQSKKSNLYKAASIKYPDLCQKDKEIDLSKRLSIDLFLNFVDFDEDIRSNILDEINKELYFNNIITSNNIGNISLKKAVISLGSLKSGLGKQGLMKKLGSQPSLGKGSSLEELYLDINTMNSFLLYSSKFKKNKSNKDEIYKPNKLWELINPSDTVLLSDKITHHFSQIFKIDKEENYIYFIDPWPDESFLLKNRNEEGINAILVDYKYGKKLIRINKDEFYKVIVGIIAHR